MLSSLSSRHLAPLPVCIAAIALLNLCAKTAWTRNEEAALSNADGFQSANIGSPKLAGALKYDAEAQAYRMSAGGLNMWGPRDEFHFAWKKMRGDFVLTARASWISQGVDPHRKYGWIVRKSLDEDSPYVDIALHGDGLTSMQYRRTPGGETEQIKFETTHPRDFQISRAAGIYEAAAAREGEMFTRTTLADLDLGDEVFVGLFVCSHNPEVIEEAVFENVRVTIPPKPDFRPYRDYIGSRLEVMDVQTGKRRVLHEVTDSLQAPNWTRDGQTLIYNRGGSLFAYSLADHKVSKINTDFASQNNNDHVLSFKGDRLGISHHTGANRKSVIYTLPVSGGVPKRVTREDAHSYLHSWSPDDKYLLFTGERDGDFDIIRIPEAGGEEVNLTRSPGLDDGAEYAPDGKTIYFNSSRSGRMQIWKMNADGANQAQVTSDEHNNWFPHFSPDGSAFVYLAFPSDTKPDDHPFYRHVYLMWKPTDGGPAKVIAYIFGGQGTINVPSWSPDGKQLAFVSNSQISEPR